MNKTVDVVLRAPRTAASLQEIARAMALRRGVQRVEANVVVPGSERASRRHWPELAGGVAGVVMIWSDDIDALAPPEPHVRRFQVTEHVGIDHRLEVDPASGAAIGVKHVALLCSTVARPEFVEHYRHHVSLVHEHMPDMHRYVQNDVTACASPSYERVFGISELSFTSDETYQNRYVAGEQGAADFRAHEGFLDLGRSITVQVIEHIVPTGADMPGAPRDRPDDQASARSASARSIL